MPAGTHDLLELVDDVEPEPPVGTGTGVGLSVGGRAALGGLGPVRAGIRYPAHDAAPAEAGRAVVAALQRSQLRAHPRSRARHARLRVLPGEGDGRDAARPQAGDP